MKFQTLCAILLAVLPAALAVDQKKFAIVWFPDGSSKSSSYKEVEKYIVSNGGKITHRYQIISGFAVELPAKTLENVHAMSAQHSFTVEEDEVMTTD